MVYIAFFFVAGILCGSLLKTTSPVLSICKSLTLLSILALLFLLGYGAGASPGITMHFGEIGFKACTISVLSVIGSVVSVMLFNRYLLKK